MKTHKNLYPQITEFHNLYRAFQKASRGKRSSADVAAFEYDVEKNLLALRDELQMETYRPGGYYHFRIHDPKPRVISAAPFRDRVVHHALCNVIEPLFEKRFVEDSKTNLEGLRDLRGFCSGRARGRNLSCLEGRAVMRGGSFNNNRTNARCACGARKQQQFCSKLKTAAAR